MAMDCGNLPDSKQKMENTSRVTLTTARLTLISTTLVGAILVSRAVVSACLECDQLVMVALIMALSGLTADISRYSRSSPLSVPLSHAAMFAGALALGPCAALAGAFSGISNIIFRPAQKRSLLDVFYIIFKPAAVCAITSVVFEATGGEASQPHSVNSLTPAVLSGIVYVFGHVLSTAGLVGQHNESTDRAGGASVVAGWSMCLFIGYSAAALYATAPAYVMLAPVMAGVMVLIAVRSSQAAQVEPEQIIETVPDDTVEQEETEEPSQEAIAPSVFVDELTGLASHRYLMMFLDREVNRSLRTDSPLAVAAFDIDGLSRFDSADEVLVEMGRRLKSALRDYDLVARHSSGRLVVVLPDTPVDSAVEVCKRLHNGACSLEVDGKSVSASVGIAMLPHNGTSSEDLINASHYALNKGRFSGEGGVHVCERLDRAS